MNTYLIVTFAIIMGGTIFWFREILHQRVNAIASIVTVIGVLGTFIGIAIGLYQFDTQNIEASVPKLLAGLKLAFITSILGIGGSIALKWLALNKTLGTRVDTTADDLAELLQNILTVEREEGKETRETLRSIEKSLTGEGDSNVLTQLQKLRTTFSDKQDDLIRAFDEFADQIAEKNINALIQALEQVMRDFNTQINEQLGDNFRQLNEAVGRINEWQEQYRQQMDELAAQFQFAAASIEKSRESLEIIAERSESIVSSWEKLDPILQASQHQIEQLNNHLTAFSALADNARNAFPIIQDRLDQLTDGFSTVVRESINNSQEDMARQRETLQNFTEQIEDIIRSTHQGLESTLEETNRGLENTLKAQSRQLSTETERLFQANRERITQQIQLLDTALQEELTKALESLGRQLTSLSKQFVDDYSPLTEKLREVVRIAESLPQTSRYQKR